MQTIANEKIKREVEFACYVCIEKARQRQPKIHNCAWRGMDNEYCPMMKAIILKRENLLKPNEIHT